MTFELTVCPFVQRLVTCLNTMPLMITWMRFIRSVQGELLGMNPVVAMSRAHTAMEYVGLVSCGTDPSLRFRRV